MKKELALAFVLLISLSSCRKEKNVEKRDKKEIFSTIDIPVASNFDEEIGDFRDNEAENYNFDYDDLNNDDLSDANGWQNEQEEDSTYLDGLDDVQAEVDDFSWIHETAQQQEFKTVYFDFDKDTIRHDQEGVIASNIEQAKQALAENPDKKITLVIEGHADHAAGSDAYNVALSERRARQVMDRFIAAGIPKNAVKIVGRGSEVPAIIEGKTVEGDIAAQWPNRRSEVRVINA
jgi:outer membrane protein OmpA-like peptidoglycan-associated protein